MIGDRFVVLSADNQKLLATLARVDDYSADVVYDDNTIANICSKISWDRINIIPKISHPLQLKRPNFSSQQKNIIDRIFQVCVSFNKTITILSC